jgi:hypothetical protein
MLCVNRIMRVFASRPEMSKSKWVRSWFGFGFGLGLGFGIRVRVGGSGSG